MATRRSNGEGSKPIKRSDGRWQIKIRTSQTATGKPIRKTIYGKTRAEAVAKARAFNRTLENGAVIDPARTTLNSWLTYWLENIAPLSARPETVAGYSQQLQKWVISTPLGRKELSKVTPLDVERTLGTLREAGRAEGTILRLHRVLSKAFKDAEGREIIGRNPMRGLKAPSPGKFEGTALTPEQARRLILAAQDDEVYGFSFILALSLGLRQGERLGLCWEDFDPVKKQLHVRRALKRAEGGGYRMGQVKSSAGERVIALPEELVQLFMRHRAQRRRWALELGAAWNTKVDADGREWDLVCTDRAGNRVLPAVDRARWGEFLSRNGVAGMRVHDARHTAATTLLGLGVAPRVVMQMMGWSTVSMLSRYQHVLDEMEREAAARIGGALFGSGF